MHKKVSKGVIRDIFENWEDSDSLHPCTTCELITGSCFLLGSYCRLDLYRKFYMDNYNEVYYA